MASYVLSDFAKADEGWLDDLLRGISDGAAALADNDPPKFLNAVALRTAPPRSSTSKPKAAGASPAKPPLPERAPAPTPESTPEPEKAAQVETRSPLQRLADKFR